MKVLIAAGGTGGHFFPGLAIAKELLAQGDEVAFVVRKKDYVILLLKREQIPYFEIFGGGVNRGLGWETIASLGKLMLGFFQSLVLIVRYRPQAFLAMGGYLSVPPALVAKMAGCRIVLHEQNVKPGMANRLLGRLADVVAVSFPDSQTYFPHKSVMTGNPIRSEFSRLDHPRDIRKQWGLEKDMFTLLVFGGSLGAHHLNEIVVDAARRWKRGKTPIQLIHLTGIKDEPWVKSIYDSAGIPAYVAGFCHDMVQAYAAADFVIARAGASTISELMVVQKPSLLVPYPYASDNHQVFNAEVLVQAQAAFMIQERDLNAERLDELIAPFAVNPDKCGEMKRQFQSFPFDPLKSARQVADLVKIRRGS